MHPFRTFLSLAAGITIVGALVSPALEGSLLGTDTAYAQSRKAPRKAKQVPKQIPKDQPRTPFTLEEQNAAVIPGIPDARVWGDSDADFRRVLPTASGPWLALSGGGADGAYGAGLLKGWTQSGKRPDFALVSGSSIGALIGPYAFLGPSYDEDLQKNFAEITAADVFEDKQTPESLFDSWPLKELIEKRVTPKMLADVAAEHRKGRRFLVATTNQDAGRRVIWNMGAIAAHGGDKAAQAVPQRAARLIEHPRFLSAGHDRRRGQRQEIPGDASRRYGHGAVFRRARSRCWRRTAGGCRPIRSM